MIVAVGPDAGRIEQEIGAHDTHAAGRFRKPLVPADANAKVSEPGLPDLEAGVALARIDLLKASGRTHRYMRFPIDAELPPIVIDHHDRVVVRVVGAFENVDRKSVV